MKAKTIIIICTIIAVFFGGAGIVGTYFYMKGKPTIVYKWVDSTSKTVYNDLKDIPPATDYKALALYWEKKAKAELIIDGTQQVKKPELFNATCTDGYKSAYRTMKVNITCPTKDWTITGAPFVFMTYSQDGKFDPGIGGELGFIRHFGPVGIGLSGGYGKGFLQQTHLGLIRATLSISF